MSNPDASDQPPPPQSAEDRKAASALAALDTPTDASSAAAPTNLDQEAVSKAMRALNAAHGTSTTAKKNVKVDAADVALVVDQLDVTKSKATELLKAHDGDAVAVMRAWARG
ncbi:uncharacterized protein TRIVIDRAFT_92975 [Trichoderma virens Gv29-8]|uniref:Nascent polypeptide-associated complex subunit alpha-like UBA domain-containing protein n=1 Tax=Hypocrea virens (strain Gv29-8 / FGSC 10586) TaxID=413071 RepID=G9N295_HYPVG|nr:uncharacterized protein TRIVIDRAFT_92975 [Trichoderma virens Gv29-8]EHK19209.1 hypothetical protein TRIVIDRAFT_92975 [Trichoderma virens Gv29-8]